MKKTAIISMLLGAFFPCVVSAQAVSDTIRQSSVTAFAVRDITPSHTLSGESLERLSSQSVADALRYFSGAQIKDYGGIGGLKTVNVRSLGSQHVGVFFDGVRIDNAQNGQVDLGRYSLDNMEAVSIYNAQKSETLQSASEYASASTVYLKTKTPVFSDKPYNLLARLKYGSFGTVSPLLRYERRLRGVDLSAEGMYLRSRGDYRFRIHNAIEDTTGRRSNGDIEAARLEFGAWAHPFGGDLQAHAYFYSSERGLPGPVIRRLSDQYSSTDRQWDDNLFLQASYKKQISRFTFLLNGKGAYDYLHYLSDSSTNSAAIPADNTYHQKDFFGSAAIAWNPADWISTNIAVDERWADLNCDVAYFNYVQRFDTRVAGALTILYKGLTFQSSLLYTHVQDITRGSADPLQKLTPTVTASWQTPLKQLSLRAFYKPSFRAPTLNDLYYTLVGNANLKPEYARQYDLGFYLQFPGALTSRLSFDGYISRITNKIVAMPMRSQFRWTMMNYGKVEGGGLDFSWNNSIKVRNILLDATLTYSYEVSKDVSDPSAICYGGQIPYTPWHSGSAILGASKGPWKANLSFLYTGARYRSSDNTPDNRLKPWMTTDLTLSRDINLRNRLLLALGLDINNLLNQQYEVVSRYPMPGANYLLKITLKY